MHYNITNKPVYPGIPVSFFAPDFDPPVDAKATAMVYFFKEDIFRQLVHFCLDGLYHNFHLPVMQIMAMLRETYLTTVAEDINGFWEMMETDYMQDIVSGEFTQEELTNTTLMIFDNDYFVFENYYTALAIEMFHKLCYLILNTARLMYANGFRLYPRDLIKTKTCELAVFDILANEDTVYYDYDASSDNYPPVVIRERGTVNPYL